MKECISTLPIPKLDELEMMINLLKVEDKSVSYMSYSNLTKKINSVFRVNTSIQDVYLLFEPSIDDDSKDAQIYYSNLLDYSPYMDLTN